SGKKGMESLTQMMSQARRQF
ncbi:hypothetical protein, partial [Campylobacter coli]